MRIGEAMALRTEDVDLANRLIYIRQDVWHGHLDSPKLDASVHTLPIGAKLAFVLGEYLRRLGRPGYLFANESGGPLDPKYLARNSLYPVQASLGLPRFSWHALRHLHCTRLVEGRVSLKVAQAQLRHRDPVTTFGVYAHVVEDSRRQAVELVENDLFPIVLNPERGSIAVTLQSSGG